MHYAISGYTAAELIYNRVDSNKEYMGLTNWKNSPDGLIYKYDVTIAKNYLNEEELKKFHPSLEVEDAEDAIYHQDLTDLADMLVKKIMGTESKSKEEQ